MILEMIGKGQARNVRYELEHVTDFYEIETAYVVDFGINRHYYTKENFSFIVYKEDKDK